MNHTCNAWCVDGTHCHLMYTSDNPPKWLQPGTAWVWNTRRVRVVKVEPASAEAQPAPKRPWGYDHGWVVWIEYT